MLFRWISGAWLSGALIGTLTIASTSPLFVRSYLPREQNRGVWTLPAGSSLRWRSEGYAVTEIGPYGMPGKSSLPGRDDIARRVALWGDSQAEGVCVADTDKIFALAEQLSDNRLAVFPLAQSGDHAGDWISQMRWAEAELSVTDHVILIVEFSDLRFDRATDEEPPRWSQWASANLPAFVISAVRNLSTLSDGSPRKLRFRPGPVSVFDRATADVVSPQTESHAMSEAIRRLRDKATGAITIIYAPKVPEVADGRIKLDDGDDETFASLKRIGAEFEITLIDVRPSMIESASHGKWPHGFQNGRIGSGHLNPVGNRIVAEAIVDVLR